jgi:hypothetical protein
MVDAVCFGLQESQIYQTTIMRRFDFLQGFLEKISIKVYSIPYKIRKKPPGLGG